MSDEKKTVKRLRISSPELEKHPFTKKEGEGGPDLFGVCGRDFLYTPQEDKCFPGSLATYSFSAKLRKSGKWHDTLNLGMHVRGCDEEGVGIHFNPRNEEDVKESLETQSHLIEPLLLMREVLQGVTFSEEEIEVSADSPVAGVEDIFDD